ncbi:MAG TPA: 4-hydroxyphenylpyruvate dioxygenase [Xenococcaceae cyanobacterium]
MKIDRVCFYVADAAKTSNWLINHLGFELIATNQDNHTYTKIIANQKIYLEIASPLNTCSPVAHYLDSHPEGIVDIAFSVSNISAILARATKLGVAILQPLNQQNQIKYAQIAGWESLKHTLIEYPAIFLEDNGLDNQVTKDAKKLLTKPQLNLISIDHIVLNVAQGQIQQAVAYYQALFDFKIQQTFQIQTPRSGLYSEALIDPTGQVQFNLNEPTSTNSQIQEFIAINRGAGIQHLALRSPNIIETVAQMRHLGVEFLAVPPAYYQNLQLRLNRDSVSISNPQWQQIMAAEILVDWHQHQPKSLLKQIFTQPILEQPTFFLEIIERSHNAQGFGEGNFQALFEAVEKNTALSDQASILI